LPTQILARLSSPYRQIARDSSAWATNTKGLQVPEIVWKIIPVAALILSGWTFWRSTVRDREECEVTLLRRAHAVKKELVNYERMLLIMQDYYPAIARMISAPGGFEWEACRRHYDRMEAIIEDVQVTRCKVDEMIARNPPATHAVRMYWEDTHARMEVQVKRAEGMLDDVRALYEGAVTMLRSKGWEDRILLPPELSRR
jgi:hypothetical protein